MVAGAVHPTAPPGYEPVVYLCQNILITNIHYYPKQQQTVGFISVDAMYSFWYISNKMQRYTVHLFMENCSTCFGRYLHPSSGAHNCIYSIWYLLNRYWYLPLLWKSWNCWAVPTLPRYCFTCFGWYLHPSSGAHTTVFTVSGTCQTVTATCLYCGKVGTALQFQLFHDSSR